MDENLYNSKKEDETIKNDNAEKKDQFLSEEYKDVVQPMDEEHKDEVQPVDEVQHADEIQPVDEVQHPDTKAEDIIHYLDTEIEDSNRNQNKKTGDENIPPETTKSIREEENKPEEKTVQEKKIGSKVVTAVETFWNNINPVPKRNFIIPFIFFSGTLIYLEILLHLLLYRNIDLRILYPILFALPISTLLTLFTGFFSKTINKIMMWAFTGITCLIFGVQLVYFNVFKVFFSFQSLSLAGDAMSEFGSDIITAIKASIVGVILILLPLLILAILMKRFYDWDKRDFKGQCILFVGTITLHIVTLFTLMFSGKGDFTPYDLYHNFKVLDLCGEQLGILTMTRLDLNNLLVGESELVLADTTLLLLEDTPEPTQAPIPTPEMIPSTIPSKPEAIFIPILSPTPTPIDRSPNAMDFDFNALAESEKNKTIKTLHQYFSSVPPTNKNEYTGMFQGYNLILITAEGFSPYAVSKEKTPTLYKLVNEGFVFNNFYTALWQTSTSDGEYLPLTGLIPVGVRSMNLSRNNLLPFTLANQFNRLGVASKAYHNHTYTYYNRDETHPNLGYDFKAVGNGLVLEHDVWPNSDVEMINATVDEFIGEKQFHVYYLTISGHMNYTFVGNSMSYKNRDLVADLPYSSDVKAYIACQMELDMALEQLISRLEETGVADRTVIALSADHYPYGWEKEKLDELAGHVIDPNFEIYKNHFILWNPGMKENIIVEEPCSSLDILPTLSNLFGLEYDSRLLMGQDILSDADPLVILSNRSFITDKVMYNSQTRETTLLTDALLPEDYIDNINRVIKNKFSVSKSILDVDYYRYIFPEDSE